MRTTWKFTLRLVDEQTVDMPRGAEVLTVQMQFGMPQMWAIVDPEQPQQPVHISIRGTGHPLGQVGKYIGTFQMDGGGLVFHAFVAYPETRAA